MCSQCMSPTCAALQDSLSTEQRPFTLTTIAAVLRYPRIHRPRKCSVVLPRAFLLESPTQQLVKTLITREGGGGLGSHFLDPMIEKAFYCHWYLSICITL